MNNHIEFTFYREHTSSNGDSMMVMTMSDEHLRSTIGVYMRKLQAVTMSPANLLNRLDPLTQIVLEDSYKKRIKLNKDQIPFLLATLNTYMSEAVLVRSMVDLIPLYQQAVGRVAAMPNFLDQTLVIEGDDNLFDVESDPNYSGN